MRAWSPSQAFCRRWREARYARMPSFACAGYAEACSDRNEPGRSTLKSQLRLLFRLIHPDLFHNQPLEQAVNQNSFQLLQEYLDAAKGGETHEHGLYHFVFLIREGATAENFKKVEISLPPPRARYINEKKNAELLPSTRQALARLFDACGLSGFDCSLWSLDEKQIRLSELFQQASEILRKNEISAVNFERQLATSKNALHVGRGIRISIRPPLSETSSRNQVESLEKLAISLDGAQDAKLSGHNLIIGDCYGVDALGNIWLDHKEGIEDWSRFLNDVDISEAVRKRREANNRKLLELKTARVLEVEMVFTHNKLAIQPEYSSFLNSIIEDAVVSGAVGEGKFLNLPLRITCSDREINSTYTNSTKGDKTSGLCVDKAFGYISVPVGESLPNIYNYIEQHGHEALQIRESIKHSEKHVDHVKLLVRRKLHLRELIFDRSLRRDMCLAACTRLIQFAPILGMYMEGLSVCISDEHRLPVEGIKSYLYLKWNFSLSEL